MQTVLQLYYGRCVCIGNLVHKVTLIRCKWLLYKAIHLREVPVLNQILEITRQNAISISYNSITVRAKNMGLLNFQQCLKHACMHSVRIFKVEG